MLTVSSVLKKSRRFLDVGPVRTILLSTALCCGFVAAGFAQSENTITLKYDGGENITGEFVELSNGLVKINSGIGLIAVPIEGLSCIGAACPEGTRLELTGPTLTLTAVDGNLKLTGQLLEIVDGEYVLATNIGEVRIGADLVTCEGDGCLPETETFAFGGEVTLVGDAGTLNGTLAGMEDGAFVLDSPDLGLIRVSSEMFRCEGEGCPQQ